MSKFDSGYVAAQVEPPTRNMSGRLVCRSVERLAGDIDVIIGLPDLTDLLGGRREVSCENRRACPRQISSNTPPMN
jgi:hypothetical protein